ncbi:hypothetical protein FSP39_014124 [Pinctada imbricata]|uniref:Uncharacterized protein n=1 Tax=Pinctada imbricata TaxID=66713 RepID=A0AA88YEG8_PINIB|nr:hypothetical protein FSP39_014124 [Pinctada imbricata]
MCQPIRALGGHICRPFGTKNLKFNFLEDLKYLLPVRFREILCSGCRREVEMRKTIRALGGHICRLIGTTNTNLVEDIEFLLPVRFREILCRGCRGYVENVKVYAGRRMPGQTARYEERVEGGETIFRCTGERSSRQTISLQCPYGKVIKVVEAIYGRNQWQQCMYTVGDCTEKVDLDADCCGRPSCNVTVWRIYSIKCQYVTFFRVIHECVEADESECKIQNVMDNENEENEGDEEEGEEDEDMVTPLKFPVTSTRHENVLTEGDQKDLRNQPKPGPALPAKSNTKVDKDDNEYLVIILGSAVAAAFLLAAIIIVLFLLRRFKWNGEKECILQMFAGLCKRYPPDGCESPEREQQTPENQAKMNESPSHRFNINNKQLGVENLDIRKAIQTKLCNIDAENLRNETKFEQHREQFEATINSIKCVKDIKIDPTIETPRRSGSVDTDAHAYRVNISKGVRDAENNYVEFDKIIGEKYSNPVLRKITPKRVVIDSSKADVTYTISEEPGTTAV